VQKRIFACASGALQPLVLNVRNRDAADQVRIGDQSQDREDGVLKTAKALALKISESFLLRADEVIE